ncbi:MAG: potassium channel family protein [Thermodesulfobacteriota bacterium]
MNNTRHLLVSSFLALLIILIGTIGYMTLEGWDFMDSLYMTVITITTVGFSEVRPVDFTGRLFTIFILLLGVGLSAYVAGAVVQFMVEGRIRIILGRRRLDKQINRSRNHYIVCGYGRIGRVLCESIRGKVPNLVVIDNNPQHVPIMEADRMVYIVGDATDEQILMKAGIDRAKGLVAALGTDTDNVFLVLTAHQLNPNLNIIARAGKESAKPKLKAAGANYVESPYEMGAATMAQRILRPTVTSFMDLAFTHRKSHIQMEEIPVSHSSDMVNKTLKDSGIRQKYNLIIIAIKEGDGGGMLFNPSFEAVIRGGDTLIAVGEVVNLQKLEQVLHPHPAGHPEPTEK